MFAIGIGYPLELKNDRYEIELGSGTTFLNSTETSVWLKFNGLKSIIDMSDCGAVFDRLVNIGALKKSETLQGLLFAIKDVIPVRQGAGTLAKDTNAIFVSEKQVSLSKLDFEIWKSSNGKKTVAEIWYYTKSTFGINEEIFLQRLSALDEMDLIFLR